MVQNFSYDAILERMLVHFEDLAEMNGQDGDYVLHEQQIELVSKFRAGLQSFKSNYQINNHSNMSFLPDFFKIMKNEYGCDTDELLRWALPAYVYAKTQEKELIEKELSYLELFKTALETVS